MTTITITGLTHKQKAIMDILWACNSVEQAHVFINSMPTHRDRCDAQCLMTLAVWESLEQQGALDDYAQAASSVIASSSSR